MFLIIRFPSVKAQGYFSRQTEPRAIQYRSEIPQLSAASLAPPTYHLRLHDGSVGAGSQRPIDG